MEFPIRQEADKTLMLAAGYVVNSEYEDRDAEGSYNVAVYVPAGETREVPPTRSGQGTTIARYPSADPPENRDRDRATLLAAGYVVKSEGDDGHGHYEITYARGPRLAPPPYRSADPPTMPDVQRLVGVPKAKAGNGTKQSVVGLAGTGNSGIAYRFGQIIAVGVVLAFIGAFLATGGLKPSGETQGGAQQTLGPGGGGVTKNLTGAFVSWEAVSDSAGYMHFTVTNNGTTSERATCTIQVQDDFGDFGFDYMTGTVVAPGQTISLRAPLNVG